MDTLTVLFFLSSGLFLGWSLGANDAANVFGTAVGSRMVKFTTAAFICSFFLIIGAVTGGIGAAHGLGELGAINALAGSFTAAFSAAITVFWMTQVGLPISTTQAIVGAIIGWNFFSGSLTDINALIKILGTWIACPILGAIFSAILYKIIVNLIQGRFHLLTLDLYTRLGLIVAGAFGSYALGANNIGNVMGVFVSASPFTDFKLGNVTISSIQQLFLLGAIAIAIGVYTYSKRVMMTVGNTLMPLTPVGAWVVVISHSLVLFLFSSTNLENFLLSLNLPTLPLIPVSSSQAVIGSVIGIGLLKGMSGIRRIKWNVLGNIAFGWLITPILAAIISFFLLFIMQNVFNQQVYEEVYFQLSPTVIKHIAQQGIPTYNLQKLDKEKIAKATKFRSLINQQIQLDTRQETIVINSAKIAPIYINSDLFNRLDPLYLSQEQIDSIHQLSGQIYQHQWQFNNALREISPAWEKKPDQRINKLFNKKLDEQFNYVSHLFHKPSYPAIPSKP
jgi:inorganic phosphate transporter, PiT family